MRSLIFFALLSIAVAKPKPALISPAISSLDYLHQPLVAPQTFSYAPQAIPFAQPAISLAQPVVHAAHAAYVKPAATSYASFQQVVHPVPVAQPVVHAAPVVSQPLLHAPVLPQPLFQSGLSYGALSHGW